MLTLRVVLTCLAVYRATRLIVTDTFPPCEAFRLIVEHRFGEHSAVTYLFTCPWCMSVWLGAPIVFAVDRLAEGGLPTPVLVWAAASAVTGLIATAEPS